MNRHADIPSDLTDIELAIRSTVTVLITGGPEDALSIARVIADQRGCSGDLRVCDIGETGRYRPASLDEQPALERARILLLREVHALTPAEQVRLMELLEGTQDPGQRLRIIASSSVSLFERVRDGAFDERLYYRLNGIHLTAAGAGASAVRPSRKAGRPDGAGPTGRRAGQRISVSETFSTRA